jgi:hypothetical protein
MSYNPEKCDFCDKISTHYASSKKSKSKTIICFSCITTARQLMEKAIRIENQLSMAYFEKPKGV